MNDMLSRLALIAAAIELAETESAYEEVLAANATRLAANG